VTPEYCRALARYNRWMNDKLYAVASQLTDDERKRDQGVSVPRCRGRFFYAASCLDFNFNSNSIGLT